MIAGFVALEYLYFLLCLVKLIKEEEIMKTFIFVLNSNFFLVKKPTLWADFYFDETKFCEI